MTKDATFREVSRNMISRENDKRRSCYLAMEGRASIPELIAHLEQVAPGKPLDAFGINFATVSWVDDATDEEKRAAAEWRAQADEREHKRVERVAQAIHDTECGCGMAHGPYDWSERSDSYIAMARAAMAALRAGGPQ